MRSDERQKLAKERREEKAKYFGKWELVMGAQMRSERAPPSVGVKEVAVVSLLG